MTKRKNPNDDGDGGNDDGPPIRIGWLSFCNRTLKLDPWSLFDTAKTLNEHRENTCQPKMVGVPSMSVTEQTYSEA